MSEALRLPEPLPHQVPIREHEARFKLWRKGRRTGGSRLGVICAADGHGPERMRKGVMQGGDIVWFGPDYKQSQAIWREEIKPRFAGLPWADVSESERRVGVKGLGSLQILSAENIDAARGRKLDGAIFDEAAHFDLEYAWSSVVRPALADRRGWGFFISSPNSGHDGNQLKRIPSHFNTLCERAMRGQLGHEWAHFHNKTSDNPKIAPDEIAALRVEYGPDSPTAQQELDADLGVTGGRYFGTLDWKVLGVKREKLPNRLPPWWTYWAAYDWGFGHWAVFGVFAMTPEGTMYLLGSWWGRKQQDADQALAARLLIKELDLPVQHLDIYAGHDCWAKHEAHSASGIMAADIFADHQLYLAKAHNDRADGGKMLRRALAGSLYFVDDEQGLNRRVFDQLADTIPDPNDINKPLKVNADADGRGGDDGAEMCRYGVATHLYAQPTPVAVDHARESLRDPTLDRAIAEANEIESNPEYVNSAGLPHGF